MNGLVVHTSNCSNIGGFTTLQQRAPLKNDLHSLCLTKNIKFNIFRLDKFKFTKTDLLCGHTKDTLITLLLENKMLLLEKRKFQILKISKSVWNYFQYLPSYNNISSQAAPKQPNIGLSM